MNKLIAGMILDVVVVDICVENVVGVVVLFVKMVHNCSMVFSIDFVAF